jgi:hypothetical protein
MKILAIEKERAGSRADDFMPHLAAEARQVWHLYQAGVIREIYFRADQNSAVIILECEDMAAAEAELATLPLVESNLIHFDLIPLAPYPGYARLFIKGGPYAGGIDKNGSGTDH